MSIGPGSSDFTLQALAAIAQEVTGLAVSVELRLPGGPLTGTVIGRDQWLTEFSQQLNQHGELEQRLAAGLERAFLRSDLKQDPHEPVVYEYLHLKATGDDQPLLWRIRIADVAGWTLLPSPALSRQPGDRG